MKPEQLIAEMNDYYAKRAPLHDGYMGYKSNEGMEDLLGPLIRWFDEYVMDKAVLEVACGTGNWTQVLAKRAKSVVATDVNASVIELARMKPYPRDNVVLKIADAYDLSGLAGQFDAAFAADWWSHMPKSWIPRFLGGLVAKLRPGSKVIFIDMMPIKNLTHLASHYDEEGNFIHMRRLPSGEEFRVVKNFPVEEELRTAVRGLAEDIEYRVDGHLRRWMLAFTAK